MAEETVETTEEVTKRPRKLTKDVSDPKVCKITVIGGTKGEMLFPLSDLPDSIMTILPCFAVGHKLGDAAAGESGADAEASITATWEAMKSGNFTVRTPAEPKVTLSAIKANLENLPPEQQEAAKAQLALLGITL
jgi:hypothetical protein